MTSKYIFFIVILKFVVFEKFSLKGFFKYSWEIVFKTCLVFICKAAKHRCQKVQAAIIYPVEFHNELKKMLS